MRGTAAPVGGVAISTAPSVSVRVMPCGGEMTFEDELVDHRVLTGRAPVQVFEHQIC